MADERAAQRPVEAEQRHQVDGGEERCGCLVEVAAVGGIEAEVVHEVGIEVGVDAVGAAYAELVVLDGDHRGLGPAGQAGMTQACGSASLRW